MSEATCTIEDCDRAKWARGWCGKHYQRWRTTGSIDLASPVIRGCDVYGCLREAVKRRMCDMHYRRYMKAGVAGQAKPIKQRVRPIVDGRKQCCTCEAWLPLADFPTHPKGSGGRGSVCRPCRNAAAATWREANPDYPAQWRALNPDSVRAATEARRAARAGCKSEPISPAKVYERDAYTCGICAQPLDMDAKWPAPLSPSIDHVIPLSKGGDHLYSNIQAAHFRCNVVKGNR